MSLENLTLMTGASGMSVTGGDALSFGPSSDAIKNGIRVVDTGTTNLKEQADVTLTHKRPVLQSDGSYSKERWNVTIRVPKEMADGTVKVRKVNISVEDIVEASSAERLDLRLLAAQMFTDSDVANYYSHGSLS